jgi:hypothetical protein
VKSCCLFVHAIKLDPVRTAGATLAPIVTKVQMIAAKSEANCVRFESDILTFLLDNNRTIRLQNYHSMRRANFIILLFTNSLDNFEAFFYFTI